MREVKLEKVTPELLTRAREMKARGYSYAGIGNKLGVAGATVERWLDPEFNEVIRSRQRASYLRHKASQQSGGEAA